MTTTRRLAPALLLALTLAAGCEKKLDEAARAVSEAERAVAVLTADGSRLTNASADQVAQLTSVLDKVKPFAGDSPAAANIAARARAALANIDAEKAGAANKQVIDMLTGIRRSFESYSSNSALAASLTKIDLTQQTADARAQLTGVKAELATAQAASNAAASAVASLTAQIDSIKSTVQARRDAASALRLQAGGVSAQAALPLIEQAAAATLDADKLDAQIVLIEADRLTKQTDATNAKSRADALATEAQRLEGDLKLLTSKAENDRKLAEESRGIAASAARTLAEQVNAFKAFRDGTLEPAQKKTLAGYQEALKFTSQGAKASSSDSKVAAAAGGAGKLAIATATQAVADTLLGQARSEEAIASTMGLLGSAQPPLAGASDYKAIAEAAAKNYDDLITQARESYGKVKESLDGVTNEELKKRLTGAIAGLDLLSSKQGITAEQVTPPGLSEAVSPDVAAVGKALDAYLDIARSKDAKAVLAATNFAKPEHKAAFATITELGTLVEQLDKEVQAKFNKKLADLPGLGMMATMGGGAMKAMADRTSADYNITITANLAKAEPKRPAMEGEPATRLMLVDGKWMVTIDEQTGAMLSGVTAMAAPAKDLMSKLIDGLKDGTIKDEAQLMAIIQTQMGR